MGSSLSAAAFTNEAAARCMICGCGAAAVAAGVGAAAGGRESSELYSAVTRQHEASTAHSATTRDAVLLEADAIANRDTGSVAVRSTTSTLAHTHTPQMALLDGVAI